MGKGVDEPLESSNPRQSDDGSLLVIGASSVVVVVVVVVVVATAASINHIHRFSLYHNLHASADAAASNSSSSICNHLSFISAQWQ